MIYAANCAPGKEQWESFNRKGKKRYSYDYRSTDGVLFGCGAWSLEEARKNRDAWLKETNREEV